MAKSQESRRWDLLYDTAMIVLGSIVFAIGLDCFEIPYGLAAGGASGLATIIAAVLRPHGIILPPNRADLCGGL